MLLPKFIHNITVRYVELIDHMNLTYLKFTQITRIALKINESTLDLSQGLCHVFFFFKSRKRRTLAGYPGIASSLV